MLGEKEKRTEKFFVAQFLYQLIELTLEVKCSTCICIYKYTYIYKMKYYKTNDVYTL